jgi:agmatine/peptidylarginine deiminase
MKNILFLFIPFFVSYLTFFAQPIYNEVGIRLYHSPSQEEIEWAAANHIQAVTIPTPPPSGELRPISEFEPAEAVFIRYPFGIPMSLIREMAKDTKVITIVSNTSQQSTVLGQYNSNGVNTANCDFLIATSNSYWTRDYGPWFMAIDNNEVAMYDFTYNRPRPQDNQINTQLANFLSGDGVQINRYASTVQTAGGNFMNDGINQAASALEQFLEDNYGITIPQIQAHFLEYMGIEQYHLINDALGQYINHIDCWGKFLAPNKVLIGQVQTTHPRYTFYEAAATYFASQMSAWGMPFEVYRVYTPGGSGIQTTPYTNSLILNKKVFVPQTGNANDAAALQTYRNAMPGYEVVGIFYNDWVNTDALHCRTHEIADRCMLYIKHQPYFAEIENTGSLTFNTELYSYCDNEIFTDSVRVYLRVDSGEYAAHNMEYTGDNIWEVTITDLPSGFIEYYVFAADASGRRECHPYMGAPDPHHFTLTGGKPPELFPVLSLSKTSSSVTLDAGTIAEDHITVSNLGTANLTFEIADEDIDFPVKFTVTPSTGTIQPEDSLILTLTYDFGPAKNNDFYGSYILKNNDPDKPEVEISLWATVFNGIDHTNPSIVNIYPNPTSGELRFKISDLRYEICEVEIFDVYGRKCEVSNLKSQISNLTIDISHLLTGIYFMRINTESQIITKIIIKH